MTLLPKVLMLPAETKRQSGVVLQLLTECKAYGPRGILICGHSLKNSGRLDAILGEDAADENLLVWLYPGGEPTLEQLETFLADARAHKPDWVAAVGGGSVMDLAKAGAGLLCAPLPVLRYHNGEAIPPSTVPFIVAPTTAGTGSEATIVSVLTNTATDIKKSIRHPSFMARLVLLDPRLLDGCPKEVIAASGMDAFTQAIESYFSTGATWFTDVHALKAVELIHGSLEAVYRGDKGKQDELLTGSYLAGIALANARLGIVHGLAHPLGARFQVPDGLACAVCLPHALAFNRDTVPEKYDQVSAVVGMDIHEYAQQMLKRMELRSPFAGAQLEDRQAIIEEAVASGSTKANPRKVTTEEVSQLLDQLFASEE